MYKVSEVKFDANNKFFTNIESTNNSDFVRISLPFVQQLSNEKKSPQAHINLEIANINYQV